MNTVEPVGQRATPSILALDVAGRPVEWLHWRYAVRAYASEKVAWTYGDIIYTATGGTSARTGLVSTMDLAAVVALKGLTAKNLWDITPHLSNRALFQRDNYTCMYCGVKYPGKVLTRDHVIPRGQGGEDVWGNVLCACRSCNLAKGCKTPEQAGMPPLAVPYTPNHAEALILCNRHIVADQMELLNQHVPPARRR
ncbi:HNH endonuclease [Thioalkalivibrio thiocyanodenitrificans]|uniref:HNH endonuclease n=1 Tax=Thioalkalivibrio thiocyanodenitrificans TaxID=243063 RepID=UPI00037316B6|nr:HNH endonuclease [Thioalkalivibrio thiocyanodenitrificans]